MSSPQPNPIYTFTPPTSVSFLMTTMVGALGMTLRDQDIVTARNVTAFVVMLLVLAWLNAIDPGFASVMALLIFVAVFLNYGPDIMRYVGFNLEQR